MKAHTLPQTLFLPGWRRIWWSEQAQICFKPSFAEDCRCVCEMAMAELWPGAVTCREIRVSTKQLGGKKKKMFLKFKLVLFLFMLQVCIFFSSYRLVLLKWLFCACFFN